MPDYNTVVEYDIVYLQISDTPRSGEKTFQQKVILCKNDDSLSKTTVNPVINGYF